MHLRFFSCYVYAVMEKSHASDLFTFLQSITLNAHFEAFLFYVNKLFTWTSISKMKEEPRYNQ